MKNSKKSCATKLPMVKDVSSNNHETNSPSRRLSRAPNSASSSTSAHSTTMNSEMPSSATSYASPKGADNTWRVAKSNVWAPAM